MIKKLNSQLSDPSHPVWALLRIALISTVLLFFLYLNATKFDKDEVTIILEVILALFGIETVQNRVQHTLKQKAKK